MCWILIRAVVDRGGVGGARRPRRGRRAIPMAFTLGDAFLHGIEQMLDDELGWKQKHRKTMLDSRQGASTDSAEPPRFG